MGAGKPSSLGQITLDELIALTDEMAALVRAGVPLENGLAQVARDLARRPSRLAGELAHRMQAGESLIHILSTSPETFSPAYCAVVKAGVRTGRLSAALEGLASASRRAAELRRLTRVALLYPVFVALLAYGMFVACLIWFQPQIMRTYQIMNAPVSPLNQMLTVWGRHADAWVPWIPLAGIGLLAVWWYRSSRATAVQPGWLKFTPAGRLLFYSRMATFTDLLALLVESSTPLAEATVLAAEAGGDRNLQQAAHQFAMETERGATAPIGSAALTSATMATRRRGGFPPLVGWLLGSGNQPALADSLRSTAAGYHRRAVRLDDWLRLYLPLGLTIAIGGTAVLIYALSILGPWYQMLTHIAGVHR